MAADKRITLEQYLKTANAVCEDEARGISTAIVGRDGDVIMTVGVGTRKFFPDPDPDPLDEVCDG